MTITQQFDNEEAPPSSKTPESLHEFLLRSPLRGADLDLKRIVDYPSDKVFGAD